MTQLDLFTSTPATCGSCRHLGAAIDSGVRYCMACLTWRWAADRIDCRSRAAA